MKTDPKPLELPQYMWQIRNSMKKLLLTLIFILSVNIGYSQLFTKKKILNNENFDKPTISWGYFLGMNNYDFNFDYKVNLEDIQTQKSFGFNVGLIGNLRINDYLDIKLFYNLYFP